MRQSSRISWEEFLRRRHGLNPEIKKNNFNNADTMRRVGRCANTDGDDAACDGYRFSTQITGESDNIGLESSLLR